MAMKEQDIKWFRPLWLRVLVTLFVAGWAAFEWFVSRDAFWGTITLAALAYCFWNFFISFPKDSGDNAKPEA